MIIKSKFKDYYDFVANQYGGGDPKVLYLRDRISPATPSGETSKLFTVDEFPIYDPASWPPNYANYHLAYLIVVGKAYLLSRSATCWPSDVNKYKICEPAKVIESQKRRLRGFARPRTVFEFRTEYPFLIHLSRLVGAPVFVIDRVQSPWRSGQFEVHVCGQCPILEEIGFPAIARPQQVYQDLAYFMGNTMKPHPDTDPPLEVSNTEKILKAGFDLKQSFRHRP